MINAVLVLLDVIRGYCHGCNRPGRVGVFRVAEVPCLFNLCRACLEQFAEQLGEERRP